MFLLPPSRSTQQSSDAGERPTALPLLPVGTRSWSPAGPARASRCGLARLSMAFLTRPASLLPERAPSACGHPRPFVPSCTLPPSFLGALWPVLVFRAALTTLQSLGVCVCLSVVSLPRWASVLFTARSHGSQHAAWKVTGAQLSD